MTNRRLPDYGLDAPGLVRGFQIAGGLLLIAGIAALTRHSALFVTLGWTACSGGLVLLTEALLMIRSSRTGKMRARDRLLDQLDLTGDETVLDVGCGRGLLLIGAAKRLRHGKAIGIDHWSQDDLSDNSADATLANAAAEGVADRVEVRGGDMREMPFADSTFDAVVASLSIHNIYDAAGRRQAIREIVRVCKQDGRVALLDFRHVGEYARFLREEGMSDVRVSGMSFTIFPPVRTVTATKGPAAGNRFAHREAAHAGNNGDLAADERG
jgi:ubiquinone/menaquinone biosynthesis C-methylase UbiE